MVISELIQELLVMKKAHGDLPVCCITDAGPGGLSEKELLIEDMIVYESSPDDDLDIGPHVMIGIC